ncbi:MAG TPA: hypothetical protein VJ957_12160 [Longimicrobiales bacterium]|nr:hypothetical protein [Longimicrobiales bacterium]
MAISRPWFRAALLAAVALPTLAACEDSVTNPDEVLVASEAEAVLRSAAAMPALLGVIDTVLVDSVALPDGVRYSLHTAEELWARAAADDDPARAARRRASAVALAAPYVADHMDAARLVDLRHRLRAWVDVASGMLKHLRLPQVERDLDGAAELLARSEAAEARGEHRTAVWLALSAQSRLVDTTPRVVARRMSDGALARYRRASADGSIRDEQTRQRVERLVAGAREALDQEDYLRAIQRAYYATELLEMR